MPARRSSILILLAAGGLLGLTGGARADTCTCNITVYSSYRWMDPWWGLECDEHCGHGYVGSSCDTAHGQGCGAMTGYVRLRYSSGSTIKNRDCPDDHYTCFRGPSACDSGGSWGNVCNADIWHCVSGGYSDGSWECNGLSDSGWVYQTSASGVTFGGACGTNWFNVLEYIEEHDPFCCDDPMGFINVSTYTAEGTRTVYLSGGDENCNGGSQGGVYPHCGKFGATLPVVMSCYTTISGGGGGGGGGGECLLPNCEIPALRGDGEGDLATAAALAGEPHQALAESLARRQQGMASTPRERVEAGVAERARRLGVSAPVAALTELLVEAGVAELDRDGCYVEHRAEAAQACRGFEGRLDHLSVAFERLSGGLSLEEFRSGSVLRGPPPEPAAPQP